jgi:hypothetical protein
MASWTEIFNSAILPLGQREITSIDDAVTSARKCKAVYLAMADEVMYSHPWKVAMQRLYVAADAVAPAFGAAFAYTIPSDPFCLRVWRVGDDDDNWFAEGCGRWEVEGTKILTDLPGPLKVRYIGRVTDPGRFSGMLATAISRRIAMEVAYTLTNSRDSETKATNDYEKILSQARSLDSQQGTPEQLERSSILMARY